VLNELKCNVSIGYTGKPAYKHPVIVNRLAHALNCPAYKGDRDQYSDGLCPIAEDIIPRSVNAYTFGPKDVHKANAEKLALAIRQLS
jgi:hypothetical protein